MKTYLMRTHCVTLILLFCAVFVSQNISANEPILETANTFDCTLNFNDLIVDFVTAGETKNLGYTTSGGCGSSFTYTKPSWITSIIKSGNSLNITASSNSGSSRDGQVDVYEGSTWVGTFYVNQDGTAPPPDCTTITGFNNSTFSSSQETKTFTVDYQDSNCGASIPSFTFTEQGSALPSWVTVTQTGSSVYVTLDLNITGSQRSIQILGSGSGKTILATMTQPCSIQTWYKDSDGDGYASTTVSSCNPGAGYTLTVLPLGDCEDNDSAINPDTLWYKDSDNDGFAESTTTECDPGNGYTMSVLPLGDCNDSNPALHPNTVWYKDSDNDNFYISSQGCSSPGTGYSITVPSDTRADCNDNESAIHPDTVWYADSDGDGFRDSGGASQTQCTAPSGNWTYQTAIDNCPSQPYSAGNSGCDPGCGTVSLSNTLVDFTDAGGTTNITASFPSGCAAPYTITIVKVTTANWLDVTVSGNSISLDADPNTGSALSVELHVYVNGLHASNGGVIYVSQDGAPPPPDCNTIAGFNNSSFTALEETQNFTIDYQDAYCTEAIPSFTFTDQGGPLPAWTEVSQSGSTVYVTLEINSSGSQRTVDILGTSGSKTITATMTQPCLQQTWYEDTDGDGFRDPGGQHTLSCEPPSEFWTHSTEDDICPNDFGTNNVSQKWYADTDGDGLGDASVWLEQCSQPANYVLDDTDLCPTVYSLTNDCFGTNDPLPTDQNYIYTRNYQTERSNGTSFFTADDALVQQVTYFDGIGRPIQQNAMDHSYDHSGPTLVKNDLVTHISYDDFGRSEREWLPVPEEVDNIGVFRTSDLETATRNFYKTKYAADFPTLTNTDINAYSQKQLEDSPLSRVLKQAAPGEDWLLVENAEDHAIEFEYGANAANEVRMFSVDLAGGIENPVLAENGDYAEGRLYKSLTYDENHDGTTTKNHTAEEYTDKQGRVVLKRTYTDTDLDANGSLGAGETQVAHDTYYVYDDYGNLTFVLPPKMDASSASLATVVSNMDDLGYQYVYDHRNRLVEKQLPGKAREYIVYNKLDQPIMTQDSVQRVSGEWLFTKYDAFGRVAYTGKAVEMDGANPRSRADVQNNANNVSGNLWVERSTSFSMDNMTVEYGNTAYPTTTVSEMLTINYYDDHTFNTADEPTPPVDVFGVSLDSRTKGLATGSKVKVLDPDATAGQETWITTITRYDAKGRPIYTYSENDFLQTTDIMETQLDFVGRPLKVRSEHTRSGNTVVTIDNFTYDHLGRLLKLTQCIGDGTLGDNCGNVNVVANLELLDASVTTNQTATSRIEVKATNNPVTLSGTLTLRVDPNANSSGGDQELIVYNQYDELGQLEAKKVGGTPNTTYALTNGLQTVDYAYNVRGWLTDINDVTDTTPDRLFNFKIFYSGGGTALYNGNIARTQWRTDNVDDGLKQYDYSYDALNRITGALSNFAQDRYGISGISYDRNGNIQALERNGHVVETPDPNTSSHFGVMDDLTYAYSGNQLMKVTDDAVVDGFGFKDDAVNTATDGQDDYDYDVNGNMTRDDNKGITAIVYNHLNLPTSVSLNSGTITYIYDAAGTKLRKTAGNSVTDYAGNYVYTDNAGTPSLEFFSHPEGYATPDGQGSYDYVYQYKDHLGNIRLSFVDNNGTLEIVEENNYYPFGLKYKGYNDGMSALGNDVAQRWKFGGKEYQEELDLAWYDVTARNYDPALGRWMNLDPLAEQMRRHSPYNYAFDNPISFIDPDGMKPWWINNGDGTWTAEAGDSAASLAEDAGISLERANQVVENQLGPNYIGEDGELKSDVEIGDVVDIPETDFLSDEEFNESFLSGRNEDVGEREVQVLDMDNDGRLETGVADGDTARIFHNKKSTLDKVAKPETAVPQAAKQILKLLGMNAGSLLSTQGLNTHENGLLERRDLGLPGTASQREVDSAKIVSFLKEKKFEPILKD